MTNSSVAKPNSPCEDAVVANVAQVYTNYEIGRQIVKEGQGGKRRADYGKQILSDLSSRLTRHFGRDFSVDNLQNMRSFYTLPIPLPKFPESNCRSPASENTRRRLVNLLAENTRRRLLNSLSAGLITFS